MSNERETQEVWAATLQECEECFNWHGEHASDCTQFADDEVWDEEPWTCRNCQEVNHDPQDGYCEGCGQDQEGNS